VAYEALLFRWVIDTHVAGWQSYYGMIFGNLDI